MSFIGYANLGLPSLDGGGSSFFELPKISGGSSFSGGLPDIGLGSLLSASGVPFAGAVGGLLDGFLNSGRSSVESFSDLARKYRDEVLPRIKSDYANDLGGMFTEMSKTVEYVVLHYVAHRQGSKSAHSIKGNQDGLDMISDIRANIYKTIEVLRKDYRISSVNTSIAYPQSFLDGFKSFNGNHNGVYKKYKISVKETGDKVLDDKIKTGYVPSEEEIANAKKNKKMNALWLLVLIPVGIIVWLFSKKK